MVRLILAASVTEPATAVSIAAVTFSETAWRSAARTFAVSACFFTSPLRLKRDPPLVEVPMHRAGTDEPGRHFQESDLLSPKLPPPRLPGRKALNLHASRLREDARM